MNKVIRFFLENKTIALFLIVLFAGWGTITAPFDWNLKGLPRDPVAVDAIPNIGENEQIVFTKWAGRSPRDIEDQITYPLTTALMGLPGIKSVRSESDFGFSSIYLIFEDNIDPYWCRSRIIEKLGSLPQGTLPPEVSPQLGPNATALGQVYEYTLEGRDSSGKPAGGWNLQELRTMQDYYVRYALESVKGVAEVASIGGYVKEYQVDIDPNAMKNYGVSIEQVANAVRKSNLDIGARTIEVNKVQYLVRSQGYVKNISDIENAVVAVHNNVPIFVKDIAHVEAGPAPRQGGLDKDGSPAVGGIVVTDYNANPMQAINSIKQRIKEIAAGLPQKKLADGKVSKVTIVPFYDRSSLIQETLGTLKEALTHEVLISIIVILVLVMNLKASVIISGLLPLGILITFIIMRYTGVEANIVALSGIAIAIGVMVDVGIILTENVVRHLEQYHDKELSKPELKKVIYEALVEVAPAVITTVITIVVSFLPVFALQASEGKLFHPLAFTKTFAVVSSLIIGIIAIPVMIELFFSFKLKRGYKLPFNIALFALGVIGGIYFHSFWLFMVLASFSINNVLEEKLSQSWRKYGNLINNAIIVVVLVHLLAHAWEPLGPANSTFSNFMFVAVIIALVLGLLLTVIHYYPRLLNWCLSHKKKFLLLPLALLFFGVLGGFGFKKIFGKPGNAIDKTGIKITATSGWKGLENTFPGESSEFMPALNEGTFLYMPSAMPHSGVEVNVKIIGELDKAIRNIPEVESVVGKWGRAGTALDPAPISMYEIIVNYKPEYILDKDGDRIRFKVDNNGNFARDKNGELIPDNNGNYYRQWRDNIHSANDIWNEIQTAAQYPGLTSSPRLQPIETRLQMLSTGMRSNLGIKVFGPNLQAIQTTGIQMESILKQTPGIEPSSVFADRIEGTPYLEIIPDRNALARYGMNIEDFQKEIGAVLGGEDVTTTVEDRERYAIRIRYAREMRDNIQSIGNMLLSTPLGNNVPVRELASLQYRQGPMMIKSENTFLDGYVVFENTDNVSESQAVDNAQNALNKAIRAGKLVIPQGVSYQFAGAYQDEKRADSRLALIMPVVLIVIFMILYLQFHSVPVSMMIFSGIAVAFAGAFIMLWLYGQPWFMNFSVEGQNIRHLFQMHTIHLSVAVWVGFLALFGVCTNDGVIMGTYLHQVFDREKPVGVEAIKKAVLHAGKQRIRPAMMTAACAIISLLPVLSSTGKGSEIMVPMAIPLVGGMSIQIITMFIVPVLYSAWKEKQTHKNEVE